MNTDRSISRMAREINARLDHGLHSFWLYGSVVLNDFRPGWSDIDFIAFADGPIREDQAEAILTLEEMPLRYGVPRFEPCSGVSAEFE